MFTITGKLSKQLICVVNRGLSKNSAICYFYSSHSFQSLFPSSREMTSQADSEQNSTQNNAPCLPSSVLIPLLASPIQGDVSSQTNADNSHNVNPKHFNKKANSRKKSNNRLPGLCHLDSLICGCLPKHSNESLEVSQTLSDPSLQHVKHLPSCGILQSAGSHNNSMPPESPKNHYIEEDDSATSRNGERQRTSSFWSPLTRLRYYLAKRRRKTGSFNADGMACVSGSLNMEDIGDSRSSQPENELIEQVLHYILGFIFNTQSTCYHFISRWLNSKWMLNYLFLLRSILYSNRNQVSTDLLDYCHCGFVRITCLLAADSSRSSARMRSREKVLYH